MGSPDARQLCIVMRQALLEAEKLVVEGPADLRAERREFRQVVLPPRHPHGTKRGDTWGQDLEVLRLDPFDWDKAHAGSGDGFTNRFGIARIVLRRLHRRVDNLGGDHPYVVAMLAVFGGC